MFNICEMMKWAHLPEAGGIYDQHPDLLDGFLVIFSERSKYEEEKEAQEKRESKQTFGAAKPPR